MSRDTGSVVKGSCKLHSTKRGKRCVCKTTKGMWRFKKTTECKD